MLETLVTAGQTLLVLWVVLFVHELGHYYTARQIVEIPAADVKFVSPLFPRYIALRDGDEWVSPIDFERYRTLYERHDPGYEHFERYVAGGEIVQTLVIVPAAVALALFGLGGVATLLLLLSMLTTLLYVAFDAVWTRRRSTPSGDYSALWAVSPRIPALLFIGFLFVHLGAFYFVV